MYFLLDWIKIGAEFSTYELLITFVDVRESLQEYLRPFVQVCFQLLQERLLVRLRQMERHQPVLALP
jgi:hypothetical protein